MGYISMRRTQTWLKRRKKKEKYRLLLLLWKGYSATLELIPGSINLWSCFFRTIHVFQGASVGKTALERPNNIDHRIIADTVTKNGKQNVWTFYTLLPRANTLRDEDKPESPVILFSSKSMNPSRIKNITKGEE